MNKLLPIFCALLLTALLVYLLATWLPSTPVALLVFVVGLAIAPWAALWKR